MSDKSAIEWTDATWNPTTGCTKVSKGCEHCYIDRTPAFRIGYKPKNGEPVPPRKFDSEGIGGTTGVLLHPERLDQPLRWKRPRRIFVNSLSDLFHDDVPDDFIADVFAVMFLTPQHTYQILTKRPRRMQWLLSKYGFTHEVGNAIDRRATEPFEWNDYELIRFPNVWLGTSVEDQKAADLRIPLLLETPAAVRFLSCEPLLGPVDLTAVRFRQEDAHWRMNVLTREAWCENSDSAAAYVNEDDGVPALHWVIVGGESGPKARPMHPKWAEGLRDQCVAAGVPFFFKQWGEWRPAMNEEGIGHIAFWEDGTLVKEESTRERANEVRRIHGAPDFPHGFLSWMVKVGKKNAGRELRGQTWDEMPQVGIPA